MWDDRVGSVIGWVVVLWLFAALVFPTPVEAPTLAMSRADTLRTAADGVVAVAVGRTDSLTPRVIRLSRVARRVSRETILVADIPTDSTPPRPIVTPYLAVIADSLVMAVDSLLAAHQAERAAWQAALAAADSQRAALQTALTAAIRDEPCRIGPVVCPTRRTAFVAGFTAAVILLVLR